MVRSALERTDQYARFRRSTMDHGHQQESSLAYIAKWPTRTMYQLYQWTIKWAQTGYAKLALFLFALTESSFFPIPPDVLLIAMTVADRFKWWLYASIATIGSVLGAAIGYYIGYALFGSVGQMIVDFYGLQEYFATVQERYEQNVTLAIFAAAFTPIPFKVFTLAGGVFAVSLPHMLIGALLGRAGRFFAVALALRVFGKVIADSIERYFNILSILFLVLLVGGFVAVRYLL
jgi:membrane protein YqaA with SNARE-associated domain